MSVDLPAPLAPSRPVARAVIWRVTPSRAWTDPKRLDTPPAATSWVALCGGAVGEGGVTPTHIRHDPRPRAASGGVSGSYEVVVASLRASA